MSGLDLRVVVLLCGVIGVLLSVVLLDLHLKHRQRLRGLGWWAAGPAVIFVGTLLLALRGVLPPVFTMMLGNVCIAGGAMAMYVGSYQFHGSSTGVRPQWLWGLLALMAVGMWWWGVVEPSYPARQLIAPGVMGVTQAAHAWLLWRRREPVFAYRFVLVGLGCFVAVAAVRTATALSEPAGGDLFAPSLVQNIYLGSYAFALLGQGVGLILLAQWRVHQELEFQARHDPLTGVLTRRALFDEGIRDLQRQPRTGRPLAVLIMDLDHFKRVNDQHGHLVGDRVLKDFMRRTQLALRRGDVLGRYGGEEFLAILPDADEAQAVAVAERIRCTEPAASLPRCTVSLGVVVWPAPQHPVDNPSRLLECLVDQADQALYRAKQSGRNRTELASPGPCAAAGGCGAISCPAAGSPAQAP